MRLCCLQFSQVTLIQPIDCKIFCRLLESAVISKTNHIRQHPGFYQVSPYLANIILLENNMKIENWQKKIGTFSPLCTTILLRILSLSLSLSLFFVHFPPRHHIIVNVFYETGYAETPSPFIPRKLFSLSYNQKSLMKPDTFDSKPFPFYHVPHLLMYRKTQKMVQFEKVFKNEIKEWNIMPVNQF